ncbi:hypothetical protein QYM36_013852 [Artemia franciscana]|uniref:Tr-type G domain-containing protein n=1 Tax=Artemia franciscana TaxID=6661 RepID=A0AA88HE29_ARTSF|nr:hypothetical protein QYM36_013852 [Artemia franciscana]
MRLLFYQSKSVICSQLRKLHTKSSILECPIEKIKNIGIFAHIDAGKTTTTERMLFYSGVLDRTGEVHKGDTVMDYMEQERTRGITIVSAAITFPWLNHRVNLIDTPGHVDFTIEVERALCVLDGGICILDASAGVQAQTVTVWSQASRHSVPYIFYLNKMDKPNANVDLCLSTIQKKLRANPLLTQIPLSLHGQFNGFIDLINKSVHTWGQDPSGRSFESTTLSEQMHGEIFEKAMKERNNLIESICDIDDTLSDCVIERFSIEDTTPEEINKALKRVTLARTGVPVFCGSSYKNMGVQPLLDAVTKYLPNPVERGRDYSKPFDNHMCAMTFKIIHDKHKGPLTFFRVFSGELKQNQRVHNLTRDGTTKLMKVMVPFADEYVEVPHVSNGNIAIVSGLKGVTTGDILTSSQSAFHYAQKHLLKSEGEVRREFFVGPSVPDPVFFSSIEASSLSEQKALETALECIKLEDPTLKVKYDQETGQTVLGGMGELHLEIIKDRLEKEHKCHVNLGPMQVAYREYIMDCGRKKYEYNKVVGSTKIRVTIDLSISQLDYPGDKNEIQVVKEKENLDNITRITPTTMSAIKDGIEMGLSMGPRSGSPLSGVKVGLQWFEAPSRTSEIAISAAASQCITQLLREVGTGLLEPVMAVELVLDNEFSHRVLGDLSKRRATDLDISQILDSKVLHFFQILPFFQGKVDYPS